MVTGRGSMVAGCSSRSKQSKAGQVVLMQASKDTENEIPYSVTSGAPIATTF